MFEQNDNLKSMLKIQEKIQEKKQEMFKTLVTTCGPFKIGEPYQGGMETSSQNLLEKI